jgi:micrococcal nuclease
MQTSSIGVVIALTVSLAGSIPGWAKDLHGLGQSVVDGDEFILCEGGACVNIRLCGIDTPSKGKPGYEETISALTNMVVGKEVECRPLGEGSVCDDHRGLDNRGRTIAQCFVEEATVDVGTALVEARHACDRKRDSGGFYSKDHPEWQCTKFGEF